MTNPQPDKKATSLTLLQRVRANDQHAWQNLVELYTPFVRYWCHRWGADQQDAEDIVQETFHAAATSLETFQRDRPGQTFRGWLRGITRNKVLLHFRRNNSQAKASGGTEALVRLQQIAEGILPEEEDSTEEMSALYQRALSMVRAEFEDRTWQMFWETVIESRSPTELSEEWNVTPAAIRKAKSRVLRRLKEEVGDLIA